MKRITLLLVLFLLLNKAYTQTINLKKITVLESNNPLLETSYYTSKNNFNDTFYRNLKSYVMENNSMSSVEEPELFINLLKWVNKQWEHDGWNEAPDSLTSLQILKNAKTGTKYRCVEYGKVLRDVLKAFGYTSRQIGIQSIDADYGGWGKGHVATEVWSNKLSKWVFLDPQFSAYFLYNNIPINYYELYTIWKKSGFKDIKVKFANPKYESHPEEYLKFIQNYFGYLIVDDNYNDKKFSLVLMLDAKSNILTFQGFPRETAIFISDYKQLYPPINQTMVLFKFDKTERERVNKASLIPNLKTEDDYRKGMSTWVARPNFNLSLLNNMPGFKQYELKVNGQEIKSSNDNIYNVILSEGISEIEAVSINNFGIKGISTKIKIQYK